MSPSQPLIICVFYYWKLFLFTVYLIQVYLHWTVEPREREKGREAKRPTRDLPAWEGGTRRALRSKRLPVFAGLFE